MEKKRTRLVSLTLILVFLFSLSSSYYVNAQDDSRIENAREKAGRFLNRLSPEEKIGQLFLVTMDGNDITEDAPIFNLISSYHIRGCVKTHE